MALRPALWSCRFVDKSQFDCDTDLLCPLIYFSHEPLLIHSRLAKGFFPKFVSLGLYPSLLCPGGRFDFDLFDPQNGKGERSFEVVPRDPRQKGPHLSAGALRAFSFGPRSRSFALALHGKLERIHHLVR